MNQEKWISRTEHEPEAGQTIWGYFPGKGWPVKMRIGWGLLGMNEEEDEGRWKGMGSAGDEFTHYIPFVKPLLNPFGEPFELWDDEEEEMG